MFGVFSIWVKPMMLLLGKGKRAEDLGSLILQIWENERIMMDCYITRKWNVGDPRLIQALLILR